MQFRRRMFDLTEERIRDFECDHMHVVSLQAVYPTGNTIIGIKVIRAAPFVNMSGTVYFPHMRLSTSIIALSAAALLGASANLDAQEKEVCAMARLALAYDAICLGHDVGDDHPERPARLEAALRGVDKCGLGGSLIRVGPAPDTERWIDEVHPIEHRRKIQQFCAADGGLLEPSTPISEGTYKAAVAAVGCAVAAADAVMTGKARRAFCAIRPPGHHSSGMRPMGFCLFNNVAIAAVYAEKKHGARKVLIVDFDVHHGNGTQNIFNSDPSVMLFDVHQDPLYPGTGKADESGEGEAKGTKFNVPLPRGADDAAYLKVFEEKLRPAALAFHPDLILISAGFDAHKDDPLGGMKLTADGYAALTTVVVEIAEKCCEGRVVSVLEGGYNLEALAESVAAHVRSLAWRKEPAPRP